ncbi:MAG: FtsW/RodA/SpoVE family cell cycle protein [Faecalicoccus sp.]|uniref:FtsW/RodA/SpoVE family cell cycle protein n=1 Tax=Faecalicoccus TaxID=1573536 RepID=UPI002A7FFB19|nr:FtsW/RodA/SpoVE family cell cycle protein [Faecalicoccus sp.]MDY4277347.1 FtsW/RodA/SpoVE family cell cycle protein [Faecalicoccus sp.]
MKQTITLGKHTFRIDTGFLIMLILLGLTSFFALYNAFNLISDGSGYGYMFRQIIWYIIGFTAMFFLCSMQNKAIYPLMKKAYNFLMVCLVYLLISRLLILVSSGSIYLPFANEINGAVSWFSLPFASFQPSEFIKIVLIVMISKIIATHQEEHPNPTNKDDLELLIKIGKVLLPPLILIFLQPDTGVMIIILLNTLILLLCSGIRKQYVWIIGILILCAVAGFFFLYFFQRDLLEALLSNYRLARIDAWLDPEGNIQGSSNQLYTALLSLGSAGLSGHGLQADIIAIPEAHTDFIFAAVGQCFGLLGTTFILVICFAFDIVLFKIAYNTKDRTDRFVVIGVIAMLVYQQFQNLGMIVGLVPITGITLPMISYGGSSILSYFIAFAIVMNISPVSKKVWVVGKKRPKKVSKLKRRSLIKTFKKAH